MIKIDTDKNEKIHTRRIEIATYDCGRHAVIVEGKLKGDGRHCRHLQGLAQGWSETQKI